MTKFTLKGVEKIAAELMGLTEMNEQELVNDFVLYCELIEATPSKAEFENYYHEHISFY